MKFSKIFKDAYQTSDKKYTIEKREGKWHAYEGYSKLGSFKTLRAAKAACQYNKSKDILDLIQMVAVGG